MKTATRYVNQKEISYSWVRVITARLNFAMSLMFASIVISALSVIFVANQNRNFSADIMRMRYDNNDLYVNWEQLLLEKSTLTKQARLHKEAINNLNMVIPDSQSVVDLP